MNESQLTDPRSRVIVRMARMAEHPGDVKIDLNPHDRERAARFRFDEDRKRLLLGRWILGRCLTRFFGFPLAPLDLVYSSTGRPTLANHPEIQFSISHAGDVVGVALCAHAQVGLDVERIDRAVNHVALAARIMNQEDFERFNALPSGEKVPSFFQAWTTKEAWLKARGIGISRGVKEAAAPPFPDLSPRPLENPAEESGRSWLVQAMPVPEGYLSNVVWDDPSKTVDFAWLEANRDP